MDDLFWVFFLNKSPFLDKGNVNRSIAENLQMWEPDQTLWKRIEPTEAIKNLKDLAIHDIIKYCNSLSITLPSNFWEKINIFFYESDKYFLAINKWISIHINNTIFEKMSRIDQLAVVIHEIIHSIARKNIKIFHDYNHNKRTSTWGGTTVSIWWQSWYENILVWWHTSKLWALLNEGFTQIITLNMLNNYWMNVSDNGAYTYYIYIIDWLVQEMAKKTGIEYSELLKYFIKWNILGDGRYLNIITKSLWKEFVGDLINLPDNSWEVADFGPDKAMVAFFKKYASIYDSKEISDKMKEVVWDIQMKKTGTQPI